MVQVSHHARKDGKNLLRRVISLRPASLLTFWKKKGTRRLNYVRSPVNSR